MEVLYIKSTKETPEVNFDPESAVFIMSGNSLPENAVAFYHPVIDWLKKFFITNKKKIQMEFNFHYLSSSSSKQIAKIMMLFQPIDASSLHIKWFYDKEDEDLMKVGERFSKYFSIPIEIIQR